MVTLENATLATIHAEAVRCKAIAEKRLVLLTQKEFETLPEYSCSNPTGVTIGKRWKSHKTRRASDSSDKNPAHYRAHEYTECPDKATCPYTKEYRRDNGDHVHITTGEIEILDAKKPQPPLCFQAS